MNQTTFYFNSFGNNILKAFQNFNSHSLKGYTHATVHFTDSSRVLVLT